MDKDFIKIFEETQALMHGHFILSSGLHSDTYFQCAKVLQYPKYLSMFGEILSNHFSHLDIDKVISPAIGGIVLGTEVGRQLNKKTIFSERSEGKMKLRRGFNINENEKITFIFSTHDQRVIDRARRVLTLEDGKIVSDKKK